MRGTRGAIAAIAFVTAFGSGAALAAPSDNGAEHANPNATLVSVHVFDAAKNGGKPVARANCSNDGATSASNTALTGWKSAGGIAHLNTKTVPASTPTASTSLQAAFSAWSSASNAPSFTVATNGTVTRQTANRQTDLMFGRVSGSAIAVTYTWRWTDGLVESDTVFNSGVAWGELGPDGDGCYEDRPVYDLQDIATHEFGHIYGLDHPAAGRFETMYAYGYTGETLKRSPGLGDVAAITSLY